jgi:hypothetical protein
MHAEVVLLRVAEVELAVAEALVVVASAGVGVVDEGLYSSGRDAQVGEAFGQTANRRLRVAKRGEVGNHGAALSAWLSGRRTAARGVSAVPARGKPGNWRSPVRGGR